MILAKGIVSFLSNDLRSSSDIEVKRRMIRLEVLETGEVFSESKQQSVIKITCKYAALLNEDWACKSIIDYTGKVKPFLENHVKGTIISVEVQKLDYRKNITSL